MSFIIDLILIINQGNTHHLLYTFHSFINISILCLIPTHKHIDWGWLLVWDSQHLPVDIVIYVSTNYIFNYMNNKYSYHFIMYKVLYIQSIMIDPWHMIHIDHNLHNPNDFTCTENMFLRMDFMNGSTTISHIGKYSGSFSFHAIISLLKLFLVSRCLILP